MTDENGTTEATSLFVIEFDHRSDDGESIVGPFASREDAEAHVASLSGPDFTAEWSVFELAQVISDAEEAPEGDLPVDELEEDEELITEIPVHGVATVEGRPTGDGRGFRPGALSFDTLPQPLGYEFEHGHGSDNSRVAIVGRIDGYERHATAEDGVDEIRWWGVIITTKQYAAQAVESIVDGSYNGLSVVVDGVTMDVEEEREEMRARILADQAESPAEGDDDAGKGAPMSEEDVDSILDMFIGDGKIKTSWYSEARIRRFDMVPTGAFVEGYIGLGGQDSFTDKMTPEQIEASAAALADCGCAESREEADAIIAAAIAEFAPGTKDGPGWITHPIATSRIRRYWVRGKGAAKIKWGVPGDFNRCRMQLAKYVQNPEWLAGLCANMHKEAIGVWPGQEAGGHSLVASAQPAPLFTIVAAAAPVDAALFANPNLQRATGITIEGEHIYGHIAAWNVCHIAQPEGPGSCTFAPRSATNYAYYRTGTVITTEGPISVGSLTMDTGHAGGRLSATAAAAHYDNTGTVVADVASGEDDHGIWFSGRLRPGVTDEQVYELMASGRLSGDWRRIGSNYELVGALVVNVGGYPIPAESLVASADMGMLTAILAAGVVDPEERELEAASASAGTATLTTKDIAGIAIAAVEEYIFTTQRTTVVNQFTAAKDGLLRIEAARARAAILERA